MRTSSPAWLDRTPGRVGATAIVLTVLLVPAWMFADPLGSYRLHSDDFEYLSASRTLEKAVTNLYRPHNTHIVPCWRVLTWTLVQTSATLSRLPSTLAAATYAAVVLAMLLAGWVVARETRQAWTGLLAMVAIGTTSVMESSATWYSSGQTVWAGIGILGTLACLQGWRERGGAWRLALSALGCYAAGGFWTIGHMAGPAGAAYLLASGGRRCRWAASVPLLATTASVALAAALGGSEVGAKVHLGDDPESHPVSFVVGIGHTVQAIPENLLIQNLGLSAETTLSQAATLLGLLAAGWFVSLARSRLRPSPLETAGLTLIGGAYFVEWSFRGYLPFSSLRGVVPWYDTIPHIGLVLFGAGWLGRIGPISGTPRIAPLRWRQALAVLLVQACLVLVNQPRVDALFVKTIPPECWGEVGGLLVTPDLRLAAARDLAAELAKRQRLDLARLDQAQALARQLGIGRDAIKKTFGRVELLELPTVYDALGLFDLADSGPLTDPAELRIVLGGLLRPMPPPVLGMDRSGAFRFVD